MQAMLCYATPHPSHTTKTQKIKKNEWTTGTKTPFTKTKKRVENPNSISMHPVIQNFFTPFFSCIHHYPRFSTPNWKDDFSSTERIPSTPTKRN